MTKANDDITFERLREVMHYDPVTGDFTRRISLGANAPAGEIAGSLKPSGYVTIDIDGKRYRAHRLAWLYVTGEHPRSMVDHRDNIRNHNWWSNLRLADHQQNGANSRPKRFNTSGYKGVYWCKQTEKWRAKINVDRRQIHLGSFSTREEAAAAYAHGAARYFGEFSRTHAGVNISPPPY